MLELILIRHGETDSNRKGTCLGWTDVGLNEAGIKQAHELKKKLKGIKINGIYSSPLKRARETAEILNEDFEIEYTSYLKEQNFGIWDNLAFEDIQSEYPEECSKWLNDWMNYCIKEGESALEAYTRNIQFIDEVISIKNQGTYVVVTHMGTIRHILSYLIGIGLEEVWKLKIDNCSITRIDIIDGMGVLKLFNYG